jgi:hypothetical protein
MNDTIQQALVAVAIIGAVLYLLRQSRGKGGGKGGCGCGSKKSPLG